MTSILGIAMTFLIGFSAQEAFAGAPAIYDEPLDGTIVNAFPSTVPIADDFVIDTETTITDFHVLIAEVPGVFDGIVQYAIYEDDNGLPGIPIIGGSGVAQDGVIDDESFSCIGSLTCFDFWANLATPVPLGPGTYWIEFSSLESLDWGIALDTVFLNSGAAIFQDLWIPSSIFFGPPSLGVSFSITGEVDPPVGENGCTPGYWKANATFKKDPANAWTVEQPDETLGDAGIIPQHHDTDTTLLEALSLRGGGGSEGMEGNLLRHCVAAKLNAENPTVAFGIPNAVDVIAACNVAMATEDRDTMETLKNELDEFNNASCNINMKGESTDSD